MANNYVTVAGAGAKTGVDWANAFGFAEFITDYTNSAAAGDIYWIEEDTYTFSADITTARAGALLNSIYIIGVLSGTSNEPPVASDLASGANRPTFSTVTYKFWTANSWILNNIIFTGANDFLVSINAFSQMSNCSLTNTKGTGVPICLYSDLNCSIYDNAFYNAQGTAIRGFSHSNYKYNYIEAVAHGISILGAHSCLSANNILNGCSDGIYLGNAISPFIDGNTLYDCTNGIYGTTCADAIMINNILASCTTGLNFTSTSKQSWVDYNNYYSNGTDVVGITKGPNALAVDPQFTNAAGGDFSLGSSSALIGAGFGIRLGVG